MHKFSELRHYEAPHKQETIKEFCHCPICSSKLRLLHLNTADYSQITETPTCPECGFIAKARFHTVQ
ncbi:MAG: hypothetical protein HYW47_02760 [Deltaproteobacteria bacterium]|nr:hypothetical protein [Deltaproteobacteria bacterium]